jgi:hypothetical protein
MLEIGVPKKKANQKEFKGKKGINKKKYPPGM